MSWYCLYTKPQAEPQVAAYCRTVLGTEVYLPRLRRHQVIRRQRRVVTGPLFPRYLFCHLDPTLSYRAVRYAPAVVDVVTRSGEPTVVSDELVNDLRRWAGELLDTTRATHAWGLGEHVRIADGPLLGVTGTIVHLSDDGARVDLLLQLLHDGTHFSVPSDCLELCRAG